MLDALAILFVVAGVGIALFWAFSDQPQKAAGFAAALIAVLAGSAMLLRSPIARLADARTSEASTASANAELLSELSAQLESQAASLSASQAQAKRLAADTRGELAQAGRRIEQLENLVQRREDVRRVERAAAVERPAGSSAPQAGPGLSVRQAEVLATSLRASGANEITLTARSDDPDTIEFAQRLKTAIEAGGWTVNGVHESASARPVVGLEVRAPAPLPAHATTLLGALGRAGLQPKGSSRQEVSELEVFVGSVPGRS
jgi:hypothetical protein